MKLWSGSVWKRSCRPGRPAQAQGGEQVDRERHQDGGRRAGTCAARRGAGASGSRKCTSTEMVGTRKVSSTAWESSQIRSNAPTEVATVVADQVVRLRPRLRARCRWRKSSWKQQRPGGRRAADHQLDRDHHHADAHHHRETRPGTPRRPGPDHRGLRAPPERARAAPRAGRTSSAPPPLPTPTACPGSAAVPRTRSWWADDERARALADWRGGCGHDLDRLERLDGAGSRGGTGFSEAASTGPAWSGGHGFGGGFHEGFGGGIRRLWRGLSRGHRRRRRPLEWARAGPARGPGGSRALHPHPGGRSHAQETKPTTTSQVTDAHHAGREGDLLPQQDDQGPVPEVDAVGPASGRLHPAGGSSRMSTAPGARRAAARSSEREAAGEEVAQNLLLEVVSATMPAVRRTGSWSARSWPPVAGSRSPGGPSTRRVPDRSTIPARSASRARLTSAPRQKQ